MATNRFAAHCATCGEPVPAGEGTVHPEHGRAVTHVDCVPPERVGKTFTVRRIDHDVETILAAAEVDAGRDARTVRRFSIAAAAALVVLGGVALAATGNDSSGRGATAPGTSVATTVPTQVAGAVELATTTTSPVTTLAPTTTAAPATTEAPPPSVETTAPVAPAPPAPADTAPPTTAPPTTVPPTTAPPTTAPPTTAAPTTTARPVTTTTPSTTVAPAPATTRRGNSGRGNANG